ncbi:MAG: lyase family protein, partial [Burkholderiales bacterium]
MALSPLTALSPLDGRYHHRVAALRDTFSELALIRFRVRIEIEWLKTLAAEPAITEVPPFSPPTLGQLEEVAAKFSEADGESVKRTEARINHDVKAVEYFLREKLAGNREVMKVAEFLHFACTSEDINNLAHALMLKRARDAVMLPALDKVIEKLAGLTAEL